MNKLLTYVLAFMLAIGVSTSSIYSADIVETYDYEALLALSGEAKNMMDAAHLMAEAARALGYSEDHAVICLAGKEWTEWNEVKKHYDKRLIFIQESMTNYPIATRVWIRLKEEGFTDESVAAILGNMMVECGGQTLALNYKAYNKSGYYGLCQWSKKYYSQMFNATFDEQMDFLVKTMIPGFKDRTDVEESAIIFAREYERCGSKSYQKRAKLARVAYDYFKGE